MTELGITTLEAVGSRRAIGNWLDRVVRAGGTSMRTVLAIGDGLDGLANVADDLDVTWLRAADQPPTSLPHRTREHAWESPPKIPLDDRSVACVVGLDVLTRLSPSQRETFVREAGRTASEAVLLAGPFDHPDTTSAMRRMNDAHRSITGRDHPRMGRALEFGLPDLSRTVSWLGTLFPHVHAEPLDSLGVWEQTESLAMLAGEGDLPANGWDAALAAIDRMPRQPTGPCFRQLIVASRAALRGAARVAKSKSSASGGATLDAIHMLSYIRMARSERLMAETARRMEDRVSEAIDRLTAQCSDTMSQVNAERQTMQRDFEQLVRNLSDDLQDAETECAEVRRHNEHLAGEAAELRAQLAQYHGALTGAQQAQQQSDERAAYLQHVIGVMEATRGWKGLVRFRKWRDRLLGRAG